MPSNRLLFALLFSFVLAGCGGGGSLESPNNGGLTPGSGVDGAITLEIDVSDINGNPLTEANPVTKSNQGIVTVTVKNGGKPVTDGIIAFETEFTGQILSDTGTQMLNSNGVATVKLSAGNFKGAGKVIAQLSDSDASNTAYFYSSGDDASAETAETLVDIRLFTECKEGWDIGRDDNRLDPTDPSTGCKIVNRDISSDKVGTVVVSVINAKTGDGFVGHLVNVETTVGKLSPDSNSAVTDKQGIALLTLNPGNENLAGQITATARDASATKAFNVGVAEFSLAINNGLNLKTDGSGDYQPLASGATTVITVNLIDTDGTPLTIPLDVEFNSACAQSGFAELDAKATSIGGTASATYRSLGCNGNPNDTVTAFVNGKTISTTLPLSASEVASIEFLDSTQTVIALKGTGGKQRTESSNITFKLIDEQKQPVANSRLDFKLNSYNGGVALNSSSISTNSQGISEVTVTAGKIPMTVRVYACYIPDEQIPATYPTDDVTCWKELYDQCQTTPNADVCPAGKLNLVDLDAQITSVSDLLTITSGLPDNDSFTLAADKFNLEALEYNDEVSNISVYMADHFGNLVPDGTAVYLRAEGGAIGLLDDEQYSDLIRCETLDGKCTVQWRSQNPRPFTESKWGNTIGAVNPKTGKVNCDPWFGQPAPCTYGISNANNDPNGVPLGARATILATTAGEESYIDRNANGMFDSGEFYSPFDLAEAFVDNNENGVFDGDVNCATGVNCTPTTTNGGEFEEFVDLNGDGAFTKANGKFNGLVCSEAAEKNGDCSKDLIDLRRNIEIVMSGDVAYGRFTISKDAKFVNSFLGTNQSIPANCSDLLVEEPANGAWEFIDESIQNWRLLELETSETQDYCDVSMIDVSRVYIHKNDDSDTNTPASCDRTGAIYSNGLCQGGDDVALEIGLESVPVSFYFSDRYNNPMPVGTKISYGATNGEAPSGQEVFQNSTSTRAHGFNTGIGREGTPNKKRNGELFFEFETPKGNKSRPYIRIHDDG